MAAGAAWRECRAGRDDPNRFGHGVAAGLWFVKVNVLRDHHALNNRETSPWDGSADAPIASRIVYDSEKSFLVPRRRRAYDRARRRRSRLAEVMAISCYSNST